MKYAVELLSNSDIKSDIFYGRDVSKVDKNGKKYSIFNQSDIIGYRIKNGRKTRAYLVKLDESIGSNRLLGISNNVSILLQSMKAYQYKNMMIFLSLIRSKNISLNEIDMSVYYRINTLLNGRKFDKLMAEEVLKYG